MAGYINPEYGWIMNEALLRQRYAAYLMEYEHEEYFSAREEARQATTKHICRVLKIQTVGTRVS